MAAAGLAVGGDAADRAEVHVAGHEQHALDGLVVEERQELGAVLGVAPSSACDASVSCGSCT